MIYRNMIFFFMILGMGHVNAGGYEYPKPLISLEYQATSRADTKTPTTQPHGISVQSDNDFKISLDVHGNQLTNSKYIIKSGQHNQQYKPGHHFQDQVNILLEKVRSGNTQQGPVNTAHTADTAYNEIALEQFLNRDIEFIYRLGTNSNRTSTIPKTSNETKEYTAVKHLNLHISQENKDGVKGTPESLKLNNADRSPQHPLERRLNPYTETIKDTEYFQ